MSSNAERYTRWYDTTKETNRDIVYCTSTFYLLVAMTIIIGGLVVYTRSLLLDLFQAAKVIVAIVVASSALLIAGGFVGLIAAANRNRNCMMAFFILIAIGTILHGVPLTYLLFGTTTDDSTYSTIQTPLMLERWKGLSNKLVQNSRDEYTICTGVDASTSATKVVSKAECESIYNFLRNVMQTNQCCGFTDRNNVVQNPAHLNCSALVTSTTDTTCASFVLNDNKWLVRSMSITLGTFSGLQFLCLLASAVFMCRVKRHVNDGLTIGSRESIKL